MIAILGLILLFVLILAPTLWVQSVLRRHEAERNDFPGTGGEFARHILDLANLKSVEVELTKQGDHYDPKDKKVRLSPKYYNGKSLTAVVVAAHEVGHALQDEEGYRPLSVRTQLAQFGFYADIIARIILFISPLSFFFSARFMLVFIGTFIAIMALRVIIHLVTLPVEYDASFNRALPILDKGNYVPKTDLSDARSILNACAMTYVAAALISIIDIVRALRFGR